MKKKYIFFTISIFYVISTIILVIIIFNLKDNQSIINNNLSNITKNNALTMMLETDVDSNEYEVATSNEWPQEGYIFNAEMSACERGGKLSWDSENNRVLMATSSADKCYVYFDRYTTVRITNVTTSNITNNSITLIVEATAGENSIATYYYSNDDGLSYEESSSNTYTFNNLETGTEYNFRVYAVDINGISSNVYALKESTLSTVYLADYIKNTVYTGDGNNGLYYHDGSGSYTNAAQEAGDNSYRYAGANPNNYVCFGSNAETCPNDNLYRIIGVFGDNVKLIKSTSLGRYDLVSTGVEYRWENTPVNTDILNGTYLNGLGDWQEMIADTIWKTSGCRSTQIVKNVYTTEITNSNVNRTYTAKVGLMYVSDYGYTASPVNWTTFLSSYDNAASNNWLYTGNSEWTISPVNGRSNLAFAVVDTGEINNGNGNLSVYYSYGIRPTFYLKSNVAITSGTGTSSDPYRITLS